VRARQLREQNKKDGITGLLGWLHIISIRGAAMASALFAMLKSQDKVPFINLL